MDSSTTGAPISFVNMTSLEFEEDEPEIWQTWFYGLVIITISSFSSPVAMLLVPLLSRSVYEKIMTFLIAVGIGAMSGSVIFILIPRMFNLTEVMNFEYLTKCWLLVAAVYVFFAVDRLLQVILELRKEDIEIEMISNAIARTFSTRRTNVVVREEEPDKIQYKSRDGSVCDLELGENEPNVRRDKVLQDDDPSHVSSAYATANGTVKGMEAGSSGAVIDKQVPVSVEVHEKRFLDKRKLEVANVAYMILFGSSANNLVDGMSIGTLAILINTGLGLKRALCLNMIPIVLRFAAAQGSSFNSRIYSYLGLAAGIAMDNFDDSYDSFIFSVSAGMYLYIFLGTLLPEMRESFMEQLRTDLWEATVATVLQACGLFFGVGFIFVMNYVDDDF
ncbi:ZIP Zinc transporter [Aphelenchoides avenae]|nr:ZIP Zinc transporter [Aphelenchus avenae]